MNRKKFIFTIALPIFLSLIIGAGIILFSGRYILPSRASALVAKELSEMNSTISSLEDKIKALDKENEDYDDIISKNEKLSSEIDALRSELDTYTSDAKAANDKLWEVNQQIKQKKEYLSSLSDTKSEQVVSSKTLSAGEYKCPSQIEAGRYSVEGTAKIYLYSIANSLTLREDLSTIDTHSYKLEISSGETLKIEGGSVTVSALTEQ